MKFIAPQVVLGLLYQLSRPGHVSRQEEDAAVSKE